MPDTLERFAAGDLDAFEVLFRQHQGEVYRWIVRLVRNPAVAEELTVEAFWRAHRHCRRFDPQRPFVPWVRRIASRVAVDYLRSGEQGRSTALDTYEVAASKGDPEVSAELRRQVTRAFGSLPASLRAVATLALIEECSYQEIADAMDLSLSAVKMRVHRALALLRTKLERMGVRP